MPTHSAVLAVTNVAFSTDANSASFARTQVTPIGATLALMEGCDTEIFQFIPPNSGSAQSSGIKVTRKQKHKGDTFEITFLLSGPDYTFVGIIEEPPGNETAHVGRNEFPGIAISRDDGMSKMTITNMCSQKKAWEFGLVIQRLSDCSFGIHDPRIVNDAGEGTGG